jgi:hypothetical protein
MPKKPAKKAPKSKAKIFDVEIGRTGGPVLGVTISPHRT